MFRLKVSFQLILEVWFGLFNRISTPIGLFDAESCLHCYIKYFYLIICSQLYGLKQLFYLIICTQLYSFKYSDQILIISKGIYLTHWSDPNKYYHSGSVNLAKKGILKTLLSKNFTTTGNSVSQPENLFRGDTVYVF